jgi:hypothetical protein
MNNLQEMLADGLRYDPRYLPSLNSDHMPMTLCAITGLGGDLDACLAYRDDYRKILREITQAEPAPDWRAGIGQRDHYPALLDWFRQEVTSKGIAPTVEQYLPEFVGSMALDAFHPVIRLGYAIDFGSEAETAASLAYLISAARPLPADVSLSIDLEERLRAQVAAGPGEFTSTGFGNRILELQGEGEYPVGCAADLQECAARSLEIYRSTRDFFALHLVTATQAARICSNVADSEQVRAALTGALLAAHKVVGSPAFDRADVLPAPDRLGREHTFKYAWACLSEYRYYGDVCYVEEIRAFRDHGLIPDWCAQDEV